MKIVKYIQTFIILIIVLFAAFPVSAVALEPNSDIVFTAEEKAYIKDAPVIRVGLNMARPPFSEYNKKSNTFTGINVDIIEEISRTTGLKFELVPMEAGKTVPELLSSGKYDLICGIERNNFKNNSQIISTEAFLESTIVPVGRFGENVDINGKITVACPSSFLALQKILASQYPNAVVELYETNRDCMDAVVSGKADIFIQNTHLFSRLLQEPKYSSLAILPVEIMTEHTAIALNDYSHVRVLVVDDEKSSCDYIKAMLKRCGVKSDTVTSGKEAVQQIKRRKGTDYEYNMCIVDWSMPDMDGVETTKCIRSECGPKLPIIIATAYDITEFEDEALKSGVTKIVSKPLFQSTVFDLLVANYGKYTPAQTENAEIFNLKGLKVLLAEDNDMNREIAVTVLTKVDVEVVEVCDGKQAVDAVLTAKPDTYDAVLMDIQMPLLNGYEATQQIRESGYPGAKDLPIIAMTANAFDEDISEAIASGMNEHIAKPIDYNKLFTVLRKISSNQDGKDTN